MQTKRPSRRHTETNQRTRQRHTQPGMSVKERTEDGTHAFAGRDDAEAV